MINDNELNISNRSYINKDFPVIYTEILNLAKKLSNRFDPETSNESDPFIVLTKLLAFVGDKLNYNVDKNVLERFMPSATQETSMRELCEMMGYSMKYYVAPTTEVSFRYEGDESFGGSHSSFEIPQFTVIQDTSESVQYYTVKKCSIYAKGIATEPVGVIQGTLNDLSVFDSTTIMLENLDDNNRVYFPQVAVAQNGVFIEGGNLLPNDEWKRVDNLNTQEIGAAVYKFGYDSIKGLPYIEFSKDIASLIGSGLTVKYIITDGEQGNVMAGSLTKLKSPISFSWNNGDSISMEVSESGISPLVIKNTNAAINGSSPESINQAYNNFKKTIGTFDTLVTTRDYVNAIYGLTDMDDIFNLVSNVQVGDRRSDINGAYTIVSFTAEGKETLNVGTLDAYDLCLYPMKPINNYSIDTFNQSFKPLASTSQIKSGLEDFKCLSHNYKTLEDDKLFAIKNYYLLKARVSTVSKVTKLEGATIIANINAALVKNFNAREVDFGYEIPYDELLSVIEGADKRIKSVSLYEPTLETKYMNANGDEYSMGDSDGKEYYIDLVAKNVLGGRIPLYAYDERFEVEFGEEQVSGVPFINEDVVSITTNAGISVSTTEYTLKENEVVQFATPSLITKKTYPYMINYYLMLNSEDSIAKDCEYELQSGEYCVFEYTDSNQNQVIDIYTNPNIIKPNVALYTNPYRISHSQTPILKEIQDVNIYNQLVSALGTGAFDGNKLKMFSLKTNEEVEYRDLNKEVINTEAYFYWIVNNNDNTITFSNTGEYILEDGEYFFRTDVNFSELFTYGSGTVIKIPQASASWDATKINFDDISERGLLGNKEVFVYKNLNTTNTVTLIEQEILTLLTGDSVKLSGTSMSLTNDYTVVGSVNGDISYKLAEDSSYTTLPTISFSGGYRKARARLDINCGPETPQTLLGSQTMTLNFVDVNQTPVSISSGATIRLSTLHQTSGGANVDVRIINLSDLTNPSPEVAFIYKLSSGANNIQRNYLGYLVYRADEIGIFTGFSVPSTAENTILMVYNNHTNDAGYVTVYEEVFTPATSITDESTGSALVSSRLKEGINVLRIPNTVNYFGLTSSNGYRGTLTISKLRPITGYNSELGLTSEDESSLVTKIRGLDTNKEFYYNVDIDNVRRIDTDNLSSPYAFYDYNNIANKWTISQIYFGTDTDDAGNPKYDIEIAKSSLLQ